MTKPDAGVGGLPHIERQIAALPAEIEKLKEEVARTSDAAAKARVQSNLRQTETYLEELKKMKPAPPTAASPAASRHCARAAARSSSTSSVARTPTATSSSICRKKRSS